MPAAFDRCEFRRLIVVDVIAVEVAEHELSRQENGRKVQAHAEHDTRLGRKDPAQQVPRPGCGSAKRASEISRQYHVRKAHPQHRV